MGGWRGAKGITDQSDEDWDFLERSAVTTLRNVTRVFFDDLAASDAGRFAMVSSTAVEHPDGGRRQLRGGQGRRRGLDPGGGGRLPPGPAANGRQAQQDSGGTGQDTPDCAAPPSSSW